MRPDKKNLSTLSAATLAVHGGNVTDATTGAVRTPLVMANSYLLPEDPATMDWSSPDGLVYTRNQGHNQVCLEKKLAALEGCEAAVVFATGVAALHSVFFSFLKAVTTSLSVILRIRLYGVFSRSFCLSVMALKPHLST